MNSGAVLATVFIVGLVVGGGAVYFMERPASGVTTTMTTTTTVTTTGTSTPGAMHGIDLQAALNNTVAPNLVVTSYSFGKGTLTVWLTNNGTEPFVITPHVPFLNGSTDSIATVISLDTAVVHVGSYLYVPHNSTIIVGLDAGSYLTGQKGVLTIYGDQWTFVYGTQKD